MLRAFSLQTPVLSAARSDDALVAAAQADPADFAALYERYLPRIYRYLAARAGSPEEAADLTQAVFLKAYGGLARYKPGKAPFAAWLFRIARNSAIDSHRRQRQVIPWEWVPEIESAASDSGEHSVLRAERMQELQRLLVNLEPEKRDLLALRYAGGLTVAEIAPLVGKKPEAVKKQIQRTLRQLKEHYRDQHE